MANRKYKDYHKEIDNILYKKCIDCEEWFEANTDNFSINKGTKSGFNNRCKECSQQHNQKLYQINKEKYKENIIQKINNNTYYISEFNDYIIEGDITKILMKTKNKGDVITIINTEELERIKSYGLRWYVRNAKNTKTKYARSSKWEMVNGELKLITYALHLLIMNRQEGEYVDHINHDTLDNRKENLRVTTNSNNTRNRKSKNSNNTSGYRNVIYLKNKNQWCVQLHIDGKNERLGYFDDVHEAGRYAEKMRQKYYGEFAGKS